MLSVHAAIRPLAAGIGALDLGGEEGFRWAAANRFAAVQPAVGPGRLDARELDGSARRGVVSLCRRLGLELAGLDLAVPAAAWLDHTKFGRALERASEALALASDLGRLSLSVDWPGVAPVPDEVRGELVAAAEHRGCRLVVYSSDSWSTSDLIWSGIDVSAHAASGADPVDVLIRSATRLGGVRLRTPVAPSTDGPASGAQVDLKGIAAALAGTGFAGHPVGQTTSGSAGRADLLRLRALWEAQP